MLLVEARTSPRGRPAPKKAFVHPDPAGLVDIVHYRLRWQSGHRWLERFMNRIRRTGDPHRGHGSPSRP